MQQPQDRPADQPLLCLANVVLGPPFDERLFDEYHRFVTLDLTIANVNYTMGMQGNVVLVGNQNDGVAFVMQTLEQRHDFVAGGRIEIAGRFIGQKD